LHFAIDLLTSLVTIPAMVVSPLIFIACVIWVEKCIRSDGLPNDSARAAGQWGFLVQILVVIVAALSVRLLRFRLAS
jgi:hypothetical protein